LSRDQRKVNHVILHVEGIYAFKHKKNETTQSTPVSKGNIKHINVDKVQKQFSTNKKDKYDQVLSKEKPNGHIDLKRLDEIRLLDESLRSKKS
jgi:hypothetical protein